MAEATRSSNRLATVRRLYFYAVALISLIASLAAVDGLLAVLSSFWLRAPSLYASAGGDFVRNAIARNGGLLLVAAPIFVVHWRLVQPRQDDGEGRGAALRKLFLYGAAAVAVVYALVNAYELIHGLALIALGEALADSKIWPGGWLHRGVMLGLGTVLVAYLHHTARHDGDYGCEVGPAGTLRRLYQTLGGLAGLVMLIVGGALILEVGLQAIVELVAPSVSAAWWRAPLANGIALGLVGGVLARVNWRRWRTIAAQRTPEAQSALRRFFLYAAVVVSALAALVPAATLLRQLLLLLFGAGAPSTAVLLDNLTTPAAFLPVGILAWRWHWRYLRQEAARYGESKEGAMVRRLYYYAVAATGLVLLWLGAADTLQALLDWLFANGAVNTGESIWVEPLATGLSLLAVGAPIWSLHWRAVQDAGSHAGQPGTR